MRVRATSLSSLIGVWSGVSLMFADFVGTCVIYRRGIPTLAPAVATSVSTRCG